MLRQFKDNHLFLAKYVLFVKKVSRKEKQRKKNLSQQEKEHGQHSIQRWKQ